MTGYVVRRVLWVIPVLWAVATLTFFLMHAVPGGPFTQDKTLPQSVLDALNRRYHFDVPLWQQYVLYLWGAVRGDLGISIAAGDRNVTTVIRETFFVTAQLGLLGFIVAVTVGMLLGTVSALNRNGPLDYLGVAVATIGASVPSFIIGSFLIIFFAIDVHWFKTLGWGGPLRPGDIFDSSVYDWRKVVLPVIAISTLPTAFIARVMRASMLEVLNQDYIRTARAKGLAVQRVVLRHAVKNALIPVLTLAGPIFAFLITGSFIIETMFTIPGLGREFVTAIIRRDYAMIMGTTLFFAFVVVIANLVVDLAYAAVDPRIRYR